MAAVCCFDWAEISGSKKDEELKEGRGGRRGRDVLTVHAARSRSSVVGRIWFFPVNSNLCSRVVSVWSLRLNVSFTKSGTDELKFEIVKRI